MTWITGEDHPVMQLETDAAEVRYEDSGQAAIIEIYSPDYEGPFVRVQDYSESDPPEHPYIDSLVGRRVRVTIEVLP